jgi:hypothetical protein
MACFEDRMQCPIPNRAIPGVDSRFKLCLGKSALAGIRTVTWLLCNTQHAARLTLSGAVCGLGVALVLGQALKSTLYLAPGKHVGLIYGVSVHDPASLSAAALVMLGLAAIAGLVPANRAARVDPLATLRHQ